MAKRPSIQAKLQQSHLSTADQPQQQPRQGSDLTSRRERTRVGKVNISAYFPPEVKSSLRLVQAKRGGKIQDLLGEALNLLFSKYNVPESAPSDRKPPNA